MIIIRKGWPKCLAYPPLQAKRTPNYFFSSELSLTKLKQIHSTLLTDYRKLKPDKTIQMLYFINTKSLALSSQSILRRVEVDQILKNLSGQLGSLTHADITLLLQTLSQLPFYSRYNRSNEFMKSLIKKLSMIQTMRLDSKYMFRLLNVLEKMRFPPMVINKYINTVLNGTGKTDMNSMDTLRFFICILEMKFVHVSLVQRFYQKQLKTLQLSRPAQLSYMYFLLKTLDKSLQTKLTYLSDKLQVHSLVFHHSEGTNQKLEQPESTRQNPAQKQRQRMIQISEDLISQMRKQIDIEKLKQSLSKFYGFEKHPLDTTTAVMLHDIAELRPTLLEYLKNNSKKMQPFEFITLLTSAPETERINYYEEYVARIWKHLPTLQKLAMVNCKQQLCKETVTKQALINIIRESKSISTRELQVLAEMAQKHLNDDEQLEVIKEIESLVGDIAES